MKRNLILLAALLSTVTIAAEPDWSTIEAQFAMLATLATDDSQMQWYGIPAEKVPLLKAHVVKSQKDYTAWFLKTIAQMCKHRERYENDTELLAKWFDDLNGAEKNHIEKSVRELPTVLGDSGATAFETLAVHKQERGEIGYGHPSWQIGDWLRSGEADAPTMVENACQLLARFKVQP